MTVAKKIFTDTLGIPVLSLCQNIPKRSSSTLLSIFVFYPMNYESHVRSFHEAFPVRHLRRAKFFCCDAESILWVFNNSEKKHIQSQKSLLCGDEFVRDYSSWIPDVMWR
jgi:hypothetical protein